MKKIQQIKPLSQVQLFVTKRPTLEAKVTSYFEHSKDVSAIIQYAVAIMVKNALVLSDYSCFLKDLIREIFLTAEPSDILRKNLSYFKPYFKSGEFDVIIKRLFKNKKDYLQCSEEARLISKYLHTETAAPNEGSEYHYHLITVFKASNGKKHTWTLRDIHPAVAHEENCERTRLLLKLLTTLTLFQQEDVRKFAEFVKFDYFKAANVSHYEEPQEEVPVPSEEPKEKVTIRVPHGFDPRTLSDTEAMVLIQAHMPEGKTFDDIEVLFVERPADSVAEREPVNVVPPTITDFVQEQSAQAAAQRPLEEESSVAIAEPSKYDTAAKRSFNNRPLSGRQLSALSLIEAWKGSGRKKSNQGRKKKNE